MDAHSQDSSWFAIQVRARSEKLVSSILENKGFENLLPLYSVRRQRSDRVEGIELPLFPGYLFCRLDLTRRLLPLFTTPGVMRVLGVGNTPLAVDDSEIDAVRAIVKAGGYHRPAPMLEAGQRVRIEAGPLAGVEGILVGHRKNSRLVVSVTLLKRAVSVEVDEDTARPVVN